MNAAEKRAQALKLRKAGATYEQIAAKVGYASRGAAHNAVGEALEAERHDTAIEAHHLDEQRLDQIMLALWPAAMEGDGWSVDRILEIMKLRREPEPVVPAGRVAAGVARDLAQLPADLQASALAATALELARNVDNGVSPATCARELRSVLTDLAARGAPAPEVRSDGVADLTDRIARRRASSG